MTLSLTSPAFEPGGTIPAKYTCDGDGRLSPPLTISGVPEEAKSLALIMDDPDIPQFAKDKFGIEVFDHWTAYNISPETREIPEGTTAGDEGVNTLGGVCYTGPCPPPEHEPSEHRYIFKLYALSGELRFDAPPTKQQVLDALAPLTISSAELIGRYSRK